MLTHSDKYTLNHALGVSSFYLVLSPPNPNYPTTDSNNPGRGHRLTTGTRHKSGGNTTCGKTHQEEHHNTSEKPH